jgi:hypothetical protein
MKLKDSRYNDYFYNIDKYGKRFQSVFDSYTRKIILTGDRVKYYHYSKPIYRNFSKPNDTDKRMKLFQNNHNITEKKPNTNTYTTTDQSPIRNSFSLTRTRNNLFDTIETNKTAYTKILTLTTRTPILYREQFLHIFKIFRRRFEKHFKIKLKYIGIIEQQKQRGQKENNSGSLHAHLILFIDDYLPFQELKQLWKSFGSIDIKKVQFHGYAKYLAKYLTKSNIENIHQLGKKSIFKSQGLKKPQIFYDQPINSPLYDKWTGELLFNKKLYRTLSSTYKMHDQSLIRYYEYSTIKPDRKKTK